MAITDLFSKRQKKLRGEVPDVYIYDSLPDELRVQIVYLLEDGLGNAAEYDTEFYAVRNGYKYIVESLCREYGVFSLVEERYNYRQYMQELFDFTLKERDVEKVLSAVELSFCFMESTCRHFDYRNNFNASKVIDNAINELNIRFKEHGVGFQYEAGYIVRIDSHLLHAEAVKPALTLLSQKEYTGVQHEFLNAYEHFRQGKHKEALNDALKSLESTIKVICNKRKWTYEEKDTCIPITNWF